MATGTRRTPGGTPRQRGRATRTNGLKTFSMHAFDPATAPMMGRLRDERDSHPAFATANLASVAQLDPETVAARYLNQALQSNTVKAFVAPKAGQAVSEFRRLGTETIPLTNTKTVKFRQTLNNIPVYGSLVTVELDDKNNLVSLGSALGEPTNVDGVATISQADAVAAVDKYPGFKKRLENIVPHLFYYFDKAASQWRLVFILEDVPVALSDPKVGAAGVSPRFMDYVVDAHSGAVIAELPRTPSMASVVETAKDGLDVERQFRAEVKDSGKLLLDTTLNVQTFDFRFRDPSVEEDRLPGLAITAPPVWPAGAVSAHANAAAVSQFLRDVLLRNNIDNQGGAMNSSINCVVAEESPGKRQWFNAFWNGSQMVYGQRLNGTSLMSLAVDLDVVAHEMFHGVTDNTARLEYVDQSGALNESYSDIFGVIVRNFDKADTSNWNWKIGEGLSPDGKPFRDMSNPRAFDQPDRMSDFVVLPNTKPGDWGGVHTNSGIHNKAAFNILTSRDAQGNPALTPKEVIQVFYLAVTQQLSRTSQFIDSRDGVLRSARTLFRTLPPDQQAAKLKAIADGFSAVGIR